MSSRVNEYQRLPYGIEDAVVDVDDSKSQETMNVGQSIIVITTTLKKIMLMR